MNLEKQAGPVHISGVVDLLKPSDWCPLTKTSMIKDVIAIEDPEDFRLAQEPDVVAAFQGFQWILAHQQLRICSTYLFLGEASHLLALYAFRQGLQHCLVGQLSNEVEKRLQALSTLNQTRLPMGGKLLSTQFFGEYEGVVFVGECLEQLSLKRIAKILNVNGFVCFSSKKHARKFQTSVANSQQNSSYKMQHVTFPDGSTLPDIFQRKF